MKPLLLLLSATVALAACSTSSSEAPGPDPASVAREQGSVTAPQAATSAEPTAPALKPSGNPMADSPSGAAPGAAPGAIPSAVPSAAGNPAAPASGAKTNIAPGEPHISKPRTPSAPGDASGGCSTDGDCPRGTKCKEVQCVRAPCPKQCG